MAYEQTEAIVVRKVDFSETSVIVTFLTPDRGRMACIARGARRKNSPLNTALDTFNRLELTYAYRDSRAVQNLIEVSVLDGYGILKRNLLRGACANVIVEAASRAAFEHQPVPELYAALVRGLNRLTEPDTAPQAGAAETLFALLEASGIAPSAGTRESGMFLGRFSATDRERLQRALARLNDSGEGIDPGDAPVLLEFLCAYFTHHLEAPLKSYLFLKNVARDG
ncbi:MAG: DNA repair protein RecO [Candidatus Hydrogenedentes bacterium ADurb.Bin101]|nr:MAG: DNA repair protein RecO [Candidatus Hydrogenedentes bacterium ADurb.Bin101]